MESPSNRRITEANDGLWNLITYCAATGGSLLVIGSAAGVAFMGSLEWHGMAMAKMVREERLGRKWWNMESLPACLLGIFEFFFGFMNVYGCFMGMWPMESGRLMMFADTSLAIQHAKLNGFNIY